MFKFMNNKNSSDDEYLKTNNLSDTEKENRMTILTEMIQKSRFHIRTDDIYLTRWLTLADWNVDVAFKRLSRYHKFRKEHPDWHFTRHIPAYDQLLKRNMGVMLPDRDKHGRRIYLLNARKMDTDEVTLEEMGQIDTIWFESVLDEPKTIQNGVIVIIDMKDVSWRLLKWLTPQNAYNLSVFTEVAPVKSCEIHLVNTSICVYRLMKVVMPFMIQGILSKIQFHSTDLSTLHEIVGKECLPEQLGGPVGQVVDYDELRRCLYKTFEEKERRYVTN